MKVLIYGAKGWIGSQFVEIMKNSCTLSQKILISLFIMLIIYKKRMKNNNFSFQKVYNNTFVNIITICQ